jgi:hypothetical protein
MTEEKIEWFGEWVFYENEQELEDARKYLSLWYKFISKRLRPMIPVEDRCQIILRPIKDGKPGTLGCKFAMKGEKPKYILSISEQVRNGYV